MVLGFRVKGFRVEGLGDLGFGFSVFRFRVGGLAKVLINFSEGCPTDLVYVWFSF